MVIISSTSSLLNTGGTLIFHEVEIKGLTELEKEEKKKLEAKSNLTEEEKSKKKELEAKGLSTDTELKEKITFTDILTLPVDALSYIFKDFIPSITIYPFILTEGLNMVVKHATNMNKSIDVLNAKQIEAGLGQSTTTLQIDINNFYKGGVSLDEINIKNSVILLLKNFIEQKLLVKAPYNENTVIKVKYFSTSLNIFNGLLLNVDSVYDDKTDTQSYIIQILNVPTNKLISKAYAPVIGG